MAAQTEEPSCQTLGITTWPLRTELEKKTMASQEEDIDNMNDNKQK